GDVNFDGTNFTVTAATPTTVNYTFNGADVASGAGSGTIAFAQGKFTSGGVGAITIPGNFTVTAGGTQISFNGAATPVSIGGDVDVQTGSLFIAAGSAVTTLNGTSAQNVNF